MFGRIYQILVNFLGESKQGGYSSDTAQYQFNCPCCTDANGGIPDNKYNLEVNLSIGKYNCWKCSDTDGTKGNIKRLIKKYGSPTLYRQYKEEIDFLVKSKLYDIRLFETKIVEDEKYVELPKTYQKIVISELENNTLKEYLEKRRITQDIIDKFNIGYTGWEDRDRALSNRMVIPSYDSFGDLNYWVARDFTGFNKRMKYKNCDSNKKDILFQESLIDWDSNIILCEGAIDCIYPINAIALLGKSLDKKSYLYKTLRKNANAKVIIALDADTDIIETKKMYQDLNFGRLYNKIWYLRLERYKDFGEIYEREGKLGLIRELKNIKQFNEIELIF